MKNNHSGIWKGIALFFIAAVYSVILFLVKPSFDASAWMLYAATMIAFLLTGLQLLVTSGSGSAIVMDTLFQAVTAVYLGLQFIVGGVLCMFFSDLPLTPVVICEIILLAAYLVAAFLMYVPQISNAAQERADRNAVQKKLLWENDVLGMMEEASDPAIKKALKDLAETIHFSDTASLPGLAEVEGRIVQAIADLRDDLADPKADPLASMEAIRRLMKERDRTAAILKS